MSQAPLGPTAAAPPPWPPQQPPNPRGPSRMAAIIAIAIALVAVAVATAAWFKPGPRAEVPAAKTYTEQETADAKKAVCEAFDRAYHTLDANSRKAPNNPGDPFAIIVNNRLAIHMVADYLLLKLGENHAAPDDLGESIRRLSGTYYETVLEQIGDGNEAKLDPLYKTATELQDKLLKECR
ncbi:MAG: hypothetical protein KDB49_03125 [Mycobacterium sp.]|nr:hypothetical protein [Mycobacterium sp.]